MRIAVEQIWPIKTLAADKNMNVPHETCAKEQQFEVMVGGMHRTCKDTYDCDSKQRLRLL